MAFTESEKNSLVVVLGVTRPVLDQILMENAAYITAEVETDVRAELAKWNTAGSDYTKFTPTESNRGFNLNSGDAKNDIRRAIALLLGLDPDRFVSNQGRLVRC